MCIGLGLLRSLIALLIMLTGLLHSTFANAGCPWDGAASSAAGPNLPVTLGYSGFKMLANKKWYNDSRYGPGSLMAIDRIELSIRGGCTDLVGLENQQMNAVYVPPSGALKTSPTSYRISSSAAGVGVEINFPTGAEHPDGVLLGSTTNAIGGTGTIIARPTISVSGTISLIKTADFGSGYGMGANNIRFPDGLGSFQYYSRTNPGVKSSSINVINFPDTYGGGGTDSHFLAAVGTPYCEVLTLGNTSLVAASPAVIQLSSVSSSAFSGIGAIDSGSSTRKFRFACHGTDETQPKVYFNATYPLGGSVNGVGMPSADSDIGIQILLNNVPVEFETYSSPLQWTKNAYATYRPQGGGTYLASGYYCLKECGTSMTGANWVDGDVGTGNNDDIDVNVTFKYYQTTDARPTPRQFSVPFTITLDVP